MSVKKKRLDELLLERGYFDDLKTSQGWILAGKIVVDEKVCSKPGTPVREDSEITIRGVRLKYASRGGYKLEAALDRFPISVEGKTVLDAGASTGGFTDCLLQRGAAKVYAADVGYGQLRGKLAADPRVVNLERTNISDLSKEMFVPPITLCSFDLSYLTMTIAAPALAKLFEGPPEMIGLLKPLYEGIDQDRPRDPDVLHQALIRVSEGLANNGLRIKDLIISPILGGRGAVEFLAWIVRAEGATTDLTIFDRVIEELRHRRIPAEPESATG